MGDDRSTEEHVEAAQLIFEPDANLEWLEPIYREHSAAVFKTAYRVTGNAADAEDVLQTVFFRLARRQEAVDLGSGTLPYLRRAATNASLDLLKARSRSAVPLEAVPEQRSDSPGDAPERRQQARELRGKLRRAIASLQGRSAEMFILRFFEDLDNRQIAQLYDTSPGTVAVTLHRARTHLLNELQPYFGGIS